MNHLVRVTHKHEKSTKDSRNNVYYQISRKGIVMERSSKYVVITGLVK
jgi:hypothetical protein